MSVASTDFVKNLRVLCAEHPSVAQICREIGIKQQQFSRYLTGQSVPSLHTRNRIARYFEVTEEDLFLPHADFAERRKLSRQFSTYTPIGTLFSAFPGNLPELRQFLGSYHFYLQSPTYDGDVAIGAVFVYEQEGQVLTETLEHATPLGETPKRIGRHNGLVCHRGGRIFVLEFEQAASGSVTEVILTPSHRRKEITLHGICVALASSPGRPAYACRVVWKKLPAYLSRAKVIAGTGVCSVDSSRIDPHIQTYLKQAKPIDSASGVFS